MPARVPDERGRPTGTATTPAARTGQPASPPPHAAPRPAGSPPPALRRPARPPQPVALLYGPGHKVVHANPAFVAEFGVIPIGVPAAEALLDLPPIVLEIADRVIASGRPLAAWVTVLGARRRLTVAPRTDPETGEVYGVALGLAASPSHTPPV